MKEIKTGERVHVYYNETDYVVGTFKSRNEFTLVIHADGDPESTERIFPGGFKVRKLRKKEKRPKPKTQTAA